MYAHVQFYVIHSFSISFYFFFFFFLTVVAILNCFPTYHFTDEETKAEKLRHLPRIAGLGGEEDTNYTECSES